jgi:hypothetical protein
MLAKNKKMIGLCPEFDAIEYDLVEDPNEYYQLLNDDSKWNEFILGSDKDSELEYTSIVLNNQVEELFEIVIRKLEMLNSDRPSRYWN